MADEKYIGAQDIDKDIMVKCFVTFEDVKDVSKNRNKLVNRFVYSTYSSKPWISFMDLIAMRYDFSKIKEILFTWRWWHLGLSLELMNLDSIVIIMLSFISVNFILNRQFIILLQIKKKRNRLIDIFNTQGKKEFRKAVKKII